MNEVQIESAFAGLTLAVGASMGATVLDNGKSAFRWLRHGFAAPFSDHRRAASVFVFTGLLPYAVMQLLARTPDFADIAARWIVPVNFFGWSMLGLGAAVWEASRLANIRGVKAGRIYFYSVVAVTIATTAFFGLWHPFVPRETATIAAGHAR